MVPSRRLVGAVQSEKIRRDLFVPLIKIRLTPCLARREGAGGVG